MKAIVYYLALPLIYLLSILPFSILYIISNFLFFILYSLLGYRRKVVYENLANSFPDKSENDLKKIEKEFFKYFCDLILETLKTLTISPKVLEKRVEFEDNGIFKKYFEKNQSVIIAMGHLGNWELGGARFAIEPHHQLFVIYHPLANTYFDQLVHKMRTRLGNGLYAMKDSLRGMIADKNKITATAFIADQTPSAKGAHWMEFMNQDTPVFTGMGKLASKLDYPVVYISIMRTKRGHYKMSAEELITSPKEVDAIEIIEKFTQRLEVDIRYQPETWLWSHRRWKHKRTTN